jgi:Spy/CpxP family protein refolding chaperone
MRRICILLPLLFVVLIAQENETDDPRAIIEKIRIYRLTKELDLTTEQAVEFFPMLNELQKIDQNYRAKQQELLGTLKQMLRAHEAENTIEEVVSTYESLLKSKVERQVNTMEEIKKILTPDQQAKYLIFQDEFEREIRRMIKEVRKIQPR